MNLIIETDKIVLGEKVYNINKLENLKTLIHEFDGQRGSTDNGAKMTLNGTGNELSFSFSGKNISLKFYINSLNQKEEFKTLFDNWYRHNIKFYEGGIGGKTYLLQSLNYQQNKTAKKTMDLDEFKSRIINTSQRTATSQMMQTVGLHIQININPERQIIKCLVAPSSLFTSLFITIVPG